MTTTHVATLADLKPLVGTVLGTSDWLTVGQDRIETFADATPLASGWGVEAAMLVDVLRAGRRVVEVPVELTHRRTGNDIKGRVHRAMQLRDVSGALLARRFLS